MQYNLSIIKDTFGEPLSVTTQNKQKYHEISLEYIVPDKRTDIVKSLMDYWTIQYSYHKAKCVAVKAIFTFRIPKQDTNILPVALLTSTHEDQGELNHSWDKKSKMYW